MAEEFKGKAIPFNADLASYREKTADAQQYTIPGVEGYGGVYPEEPEVTLGREPIREAREAMVEGIQPAITPAAEFNKDALPPEAADIFSVKDTVGNRTAIHVDDIERIGKLTYPKELTAQEEYRQAMGMVRKEKKKKVTPITPSVDVYLKDGKVVRATQEDAKVIFQRLSERGQVETVDLSKPIPLKGKVEGFIPEPNVVIPETETLKSRVEGFTPGVTPGPIRGNVVAGVKLGVEQPTVNLSEPAPKVEPVKVEKVEPAPIAPVTPAEETIGGLPGAKTVGMTRKEIQDTFANLPENETTIALKKEGYTPAVISGDSVYMNVGKGGHAGIVIPTSKLEIPEGVTSGWVKTVNGSPQILHPR